MSKKKKIVLTVSFSILILIAVSAMILELLDLISVIQIIRAEEMPVVSNSGLEYTFYKNLIENSVKHIIGNIVLIIFYLINTLLYLCFIVTLIKGKSHLTTNSKSNLN